MIPVSRVRQPRGFSQVTVAGDAWVAANPAAKRPKALWSVYLSKLSDGFHGLCGYTATFDSTGGTVDHYLSWKNHPDKAYLWRNYRYAMHWVNAKKGSKDDSVLDPYEVGDGWFEIELPSLQLVATTKIPAAKRARAELTLKALGLRDGEKVIRTRLQWYTMYLSGDLPIAALERVAPLIAAAVRRYKIKPTKTT